MWPEDVVKFATKEELEAHIKKRGFVKENLKEALKRCDIYTKLPKNGLGFYEGNVAEMRVLLLQFYDDYKVKGIPVYDRTKRQAEIDGRHDQLSQQSKNIADAHLAKTVSVFDKP